MKLRLHHSVLLIPILFYIGISIEWTSFDRFLTGDEPHYLITSKSIGEDFDFDLKNNYRYDSIYGEIYGPIDKHVTIRNNKMYSGHLIGLPLLLALPIKFYDVSGAKIFMALLHCSLIILSFFVFQQYTKNFKISLWGTLSFCIALPFLAASHQIYNELLTGIICCWSLLILFTIIDNNKVSLVTLIVWITCVSFLLLMHIKNYLPVIFILLTYIFIVFQNYRKQKIKTRELFLSLSILAIPMLFFIFLTMYLNTAFGSPFGNPYGKKLLIIDLSENIRTFLMFHFDQSSGLFFQHPFTIIGLFGLIPFLIENKLKGAIFIALYACLIGPGCLVLGYFTDNGFLSSRFMWSIIVLWLFPIAYGIRIFLKKEMLIVVNTLFVFSLLFQLNLLSNWITLDPVKLNWDGGHNVFFSSLSSYVPHFKGSNSKYGHVVNTLYFLGFLLVSLSGAFFDKSFNLKYKRIWISFLSIAMVLIISMKVSEKNLLLKIFGNKNTYYGVLMNNHVGENKTQDLFSNKVRYVDSLSGPGYIAFGNAQKIKMGKYKVSFRLKSNNTDSDENIALIDVSYNFGSQLVNRSISCKEFNSPHNYQDFDLIFENPHLVMGGVEFRVYYFGQHKLWLDYIKVEAL